MWQRRRQKLLSWVVDRVAIKRDAMPVDLAGDICAKGYGFMNEDDRNTPALTESLTHLDVALGEFQEQISQADLQSRGRLERLEADEGDLSRLGILAGARLNQIDFFHTMGLDDKEEFHSNYLAWLLSPTGSHGFGSYFLREFLRTLRWRSAIAAPLIGGTRVSREHGLSLSGDTGRLDIRIQNDEAGFICAIENKVWSPESGSQLKFYRKALEERFSGYRVERIFLTPNGALPEDSREHEHWTTMTYRDILGLVERTVEDKSDSIHEDIKALLRQYATTLRRNIVPELSDDVHKLARQIYRKHKQAIDLIIEHREQYEPNYVTEAFRMVRDAIGERPKWRESRIDHPYARFVAAEWAAREELKVDGFPNYLLQFQVHATNRRAELTLHLARLGDEGKLKKIIFDQLSGHPDLFDSELPNDSNGSIDLKIGNVLEGPDYDTWWDEDRTRETISIRLGEFAQGQFPQINRIVLDCLEQYRA